MIAPLSLTILPDEVGTIYIPATIESNSTIQSVAFGASSIKCKVVHQEIEEIKMTEDIFHELKIPYTNNTQIFLHDDTLYLGPLVGIFTAGFSESTIRPIGERSLFFAKLLAAEKAVGAFVFIFGAQHIDWEKGIIQGFFYHKYGWEQIEVPFPNVIYDRLPNRRTESLRSLQKIKQRLNDEYLIPWFNPGFFNKWEIHQILKSEHQVSDFLPETHKNPSFSLIEQMLAKYHHVYLKPANGSLGLGIYQILYSREDEAYYCRYRDDKDVNRLQKFSTLEALINTLFQKRRLDTYIVQQGITLIRLNHKSVDFRVHTNKDQNGNWQVSVIAAKISGRGSVTTHLNNGGVVRTVDEIFQDSSECQRITKSLEDTVLTLSEVIDTKQEGNIGEIGFDIGIDKNGKVWLFEANSKPGRSIFAHPKLKKYDTLSNQLSLKYAVHLTEKTIKNPQDVYK
ncbi:YheC/YheD family protein [Ferdinandcohnia quinoae]|uniref:YheC/YheD family protein n=1 Tax=Fredinandcohnia quinoae TaxID=2918902 RepID=A0AAW5E2I7_9BACI|nr:YheC/YheD family protein [Fredinandcohnia sp. SECRCQ15]